MIILKYLLIIFIIASSHPSHSTEPGEDCHITQQPAPVIKELHQDWNKVNSESSVSKEFCRAMHVCLEPKLAEKTKLKDFCKELRLKTSPSAFCKMRKEEALVFDYYRDEGYRCINNFLRQSVKEIHLKSLLVQRLNEALNRFARYEGFVARGVKLDPSFMNQYVVGATITEQAFTSASTKLSEALKFSGVGIFLIYSKTGRMIMSGKEDREQEVLFNSGTRFRVIHDRTTKGITGEKHVIMREVQSIETPEQALREDLRVITLAKESVAPYPAHILYPPQQDYDSWNCLSKDEDNVPVVRQKHRIPTNAFFSNQ